MTAATVTPERPAIRRPRPPSAWRRSCSARGTHDRGSARRMGQGLHLAGMISAALAAVPRRTVLLTAKAVVVTLLALAAGTPAVRDAAAALLGGGLLLRLRDA